MKDFIVRADHLYDGYGAIVQGELIRCKDCRHWYKAQNEDEYSACAIWFDSYGDSMQDTNENGYCHRAERRRDHE